MQKERRQVTANERQEESVRIDREKRDSGQTISFISEHNYHSSSGWHHAATGTVSCPASKERLKVYPKGLVQYAPTACIEGYPR